MNEITNKHMNVLHKLGIDVTRVEYEHKAMDSMAEQEADVDIIGTFKINHEQFIPMMQLINLVDKICESKNPMVNEQFNHLITLLELTKE